MLATLGDDTAVWLSSADGGLLPVVAGLFIVITVTLAVIVFALGVWSAAGRS